jgi:hypothetical protein
MVARMDAVSIITGPRDACGLQGRGAVFEFVDLDLSL